MLSTVTKTDVGIIKKVPLLKFTDEVKKSVFKKFYAEVSNGNIRGSYRDIELDIYEPQRVEGEEIRPEDIMMSDADKQIKNKSDELFDKFNRLGGV